MRHLAGKQVAVLLTLAGIVRLGAAVYWHYHWHGQFVFGDSHGYFELARAIAHGQPYQLATGEQVFRAPGYPILLSPVLRIFDGANAIWAARMESCVFGMLTVLPVAWWAGLLFGKRAAWIAGLITALYPEAVAISVPVLSEAPFCLLVALNMAIWTIAWQKTVGWDQRACERRPTIDTSEHFTVGLRLLRKLVPPYADALLTGAVAAVATLVRPSWMLFLPFAIGCGLIAGPRREQARFAVALLAGFVVVMLPWWARNYRVTGHFVPTTLQVGASLYDGWNPNATGASDMRFVPEFKAALRQSDHEDAGKANAADSFEYRLDHRFRAAACEWAGTHPVRALQLAGVKLLRIWNVWPNEPSFASWPVRLAVIVTYAPLMLLALLGAWQARRIGWPVVLCWLPAVYFTLLHTVFVSSIRYRQPALLGLIVLAAGYVADICRVGPVSLSERRPTTVSWWARARCAILSHPTAASLTLRVEIAPGENAP